MGNHFHLLIDGARDDLSNGMRYLNGVYAQRFNRRYKLTGHLFQDRFYADLVETDWHLLESGRYIALNPVRAGLCASASEWRWSSHNALTGTAPAPACLSVDWFLSHFGRDRAQAQARLRPLRSPHAREGVNVPRRIRLGVGVQRGDCPRASR